MNSRRLFIASCMALITSAFSFMIRQNIADALGTEFLLSKQDVGQVLGAAFLGMAVSMLIFSPICDWIGMKAVLFLAFTSHLVGITGTIFAPKPTSADANELSFYALWLATFLVGAGNGLVEVAINPLAATLYPKEKTHYLNVLHAWWPGGLVIAGLFATFVIDPFLGLDSPNPKPDVVSLGWKVKMAILYVPLAIYGLLCLGQRFPETERVEANVSTQTMFLEAARPMFLLWAFCMLLTASTELGPNQWQESVLTRTANVSGTRVFVYTSLLMFGMRFFAGPLAHAFSPVGLLTGSSLLAAGGLYWLSFVDNRFSAFAAATVFGIGVAYFWPTMLGVTAERFPKGGALLLGLMGSFGNIAIYFVLPQMGAIYDSYSVANLPPAAQAYVAKGPEGKSVPLVKTPGPNDFSLSKILPTEISKRLYPAGAQSINQEALKLINKESPQGKAISNDVTVAEKVGAANAYRWVAVLPCVLVVVFGLIAIADKLRGGYRAEILISRAEENELFAGGAQGPVE